jgi:hypothetical protein
MSELVCKTLGLLAESKDAFASAVKNIFDTRNTRTMATLKISDLSVGDWVSFDMALLKIEGDDIATAFVKKAQQPVQIKSILGDQDLIFAEVEAEDDFGTIYLKVEHIQPIPITPEILEANGLFRHEIDKYNPHQVVLSNHFMMARTYDDVEWWRVLIYDEEIPSEELFNGIVYSVHQLQHALHLAGVEKEINL